MMKLPKDQPFWTSVILHVVVLLALFLATIIEYFRPKEEEHVFEMVSVAAPTQQVSEPVESTVPPPAELDMPTLDPIPQVPNVQVPRETTPPPPAPRPQSTNTSQKPKLINIREHREAHGQPEPRQQRTASRPQVTEFQIDPDLINPDSIQTSQPQNTRPSTAELSALNRYKAQVFSRIDGAWQKPSSLGGLQLRARVSFYVSASGQISQVRIQPSGNAAFDRSVEAAFRAVNNFRFGLTPTGQGFPLSMNFEMAQ